MDTIAKENSEVLAGTEKFRKIGETNADEAENIAETVRTQQATQKDIASASQSLAEMAQELQELIDHFQI